MRFGDMNQYKVQSKHSQRLIKKRRRRKLAAVVMFTSLAAMILALVISVNRDSSPEDSIQADVSFSSSELRSACSDTQENKDACAELCRLASCCFKPVGVKGSCLGSHRGTCQEYINFCRPDQLRDQYNEKGDKLTREEKISILNATCSAGGISHSNGYYACARLCEERSCCFADLNSTCYHYKPMWCDQYSICKNLQTYSDFNETSSPAAPAPSPDDLTAEEKISILNTTCSVSGISDSNGYYACARLCEERSCCFANTNSTCYHSKPTWCDQYSVCKNLQKYADFDT